MPAPGWDREAPPPSGGARTGSAQTAPNHGQAVTPQELAQWDKTWAQAEVRDGQGGAHQDKLDGDYIGQITSAVLTRTRAQGTPMVVISIAILAGPEGGTYTYRQVVGNSDQVRFVKQTLHNLGLEVPLMSQLPDYLPSLVDVAIEFTLRTTTKNGKSYQNAYLNRSLGPEQVDAAIAECGAAAADDNVPF